MTDQHFKAAPWCLSIKIVTVVTTALLLTLPFIVYHTAPAEAAFTATAFVMALCYGTWFLCLLSIVKGFDIENGEIVVHRPLWSNRIPFSSGATAFQKKMPMALRLFGNGGLFSGSGWFWNKETGVFRAFVTNPKMSVWIKTPEKNIVVSPDDPEGFIKAFTEHPSAR